MKVWITIQALSNGIYERSCAPKWDEKGCVTGDTVLVTVNGKVKQYKKPDWHLTREEAIAQAEKMREEAITELTARFDRLSSIDFNTYAGTLKAGAKELKNPTTNQQPDKLTSEEKSGDGTVENTKSAKSDLYLDGIVKGLPESTDATSPGLSEEEACEPIQPYGDREAEKAEAEAVKSGELKPTVVDIPIEIAKPVEPEKPIVPSVGQVISKEELAMGSAPIFTTTTTTGKVDPVPPPPTPVDLTPEQVGLRERKVTADLKLDTHKDAVAVPVVPEPVKQVVRQRLALPTTPVRQRL